MFIFRFPISVLGREAIFLYSTLISFL